MREVLLPGNLGEVWDAWDRWPKADFYAGGTDLLVRLRTGLVNPPALICLERLKELKGVREEGEMVFVGAGATHAELLNHKTIRAHFPVLVQALQVLAGPPIRHMGTIGGNVANASPAGDTLPPLTVLNAEVEVQSRTHALRIPISRFITGPGRVLLKPGELVAGVWIKKLTGPWLHHYEKVGLRKAQACAVASLAAVVKTDRKGVVEEARMAWGSVGPTVVVCPKADKALTGRSLSLETLRHLPPFVQEAISPIDDIRASASYRRRVAGSLVLRLSLLSGY